MATTLQLEAIDQIDYLRKDCQKLISEMFLLCAADANGHFPPAFRLVATPFLYAVWERCFRTSFGVMAMVIRSNSANPSKMSYEQAALWLQKEPFLTSFTDKIRQRTPDLDSALSRKAVTSSAYKNLVEFLGKLISWHGQSLQNVPADTDLVMTFSNVNLAVLEVNAEATGLSKLVEFEAFRRRAGRLDDLVGRRNDIGHGTLATPPGPREFNDLAELVNKVLIQEFCELSQTWIFYQ